MRLLASLLALGAAAAIAGDTEKKSSEAALATEEYLAHRRSYEVADDPAALAAAISLAERLEHASFATEREREDEECVRARLEQAIERDLDKIAGRPSRLRTGPPPERGSEAEERLARRIGELARHVDLVPEEVAAARSDLAAERLLFAGGPVAQALQGLERALDVAPVVSRRERDYLRALRIQADWRGSLDELVALAEAESRACGERMEALALECGAASFSALVERLKEEGAREDPIAVARDETARAARFARSLFPVPDEAVDSLSVVEGDPRSRTPFGQYVPGGEKGRYVVTAMKGADAGAVSRRRESFRFMIRGVSAHEGIPGHHLHFSTAARSGDPVRTLPYEGATTEGWGLFVEGVLRRAGYFDEPREARLTPLRMRRWRALRVIIDAGFQAGKLAHQDAVLRLQRDVGFDRPTAEDEVSRYRERPGYYSGYLLGARVFEAAEERARSHGGDDEARALRERILRLGPAAPLRAVKRLVR